MNAISKALGDVDRSYLNAKAAVSTATSQLLAAGPAGGITANRPDLGRAPEQLRHFTGWVYAAVRPIAQRIAGQPVHVGKAGGRRLGTKQLDATPLTTHPLLDLLADPNELMVSWSLMFTTVASLELTGRSLWWLPKQEQILPIPTSWIMGFEGSTRITSFRIRPPHSGEAFDIPSEDCCYFSYPDPADPHGAVSPLRAMAGAVDADESITVSQAMMFRNGIHPSHAIIVGKDPHPDVPGGVRPRLSTAQQRQIISAIKKHYSDVSKHGEPLILDGMIEDVKRLSNTPAEMDWLDSGKATKARIMQGFGVNPIIAGEVEGANRASSLAAEDHFCQFTVNPKITLLSQCMTEWLGPMFGGGLVIWIEECVPRDGEMNLRWAETLAQHGVITAHELRALAPFELAKDSAFDGLLVGGQNMATTNPIEAGVAKIVRNELGAAGADRLLEMIGTASGNGNGRIKL